MLIFDFYSTFYVKLWVLVLRITAEKLHNNIIIFMYYLLWMNVFIYVVIYWATQKLSQ